MSRPYLSLSLLLLALASATPTFAGKTGPRRSCSLLCCGRAAIEAVAATAVTVITNAAAGDDIELSTFLVKLVENLTDAALDVSRDVDRETPEDAKKQILANIDQIALRHALDPDSLGDLIKANHNLVTHYTTQLPKLNITIAAYAEVLTKGRTPEANKIITDILLAIATSEDAKIPFIAKTIAGLLNTQINAKLPTLAFEARMQTLVRIPSERSTASGTGLTSESVQVGVANSDGDDGQGSVNAV